MISRRKCIAMLLASAAMRIAPVPHMARRAFASPGVKDCVIIGGGISGLASAYLLEDRDILLLEAGQDFGGRTGSGNHNGWRYPRGTEYLGRPYETLADIIRELGLELIEIPTPMDQIWRNGEFFDGDGGRIELLVREGGLRAFNRFLDALEHVARSYEDVPYYDPEGELARLDAMTCRQWFEELDLPPVYSEMYNVTFRGLFGANGGEVSALGAFAEIAFDFENMDNPRDQDELEEMLGELRTEGSGAYSFRNGIAEVTKGLARRLGDRAQAASEVVSVTGGDEDGYEITYLRQGAEQRVEAQSVLFATPMPATLRIGSQLFTAQQRQIMERVAYAQCVTAALFSDEPIYTGAFDLALPPGWSVTDVYDCTWMQRKLGERHPGYVASIYLCPHSHLETDLTGLSDPELLDMAYHDLETIWPDIRSRVTGYDISRFEHAYPVMTPGAYARLTRLWSTLNGGVQIAGDGMVYPTFEAAVDAGTIAAERIDEWL